MSEEKTWTLVRGSETGQRIWKDQDDNLYLVDHSGDGGPGPVGSLETYGNPDSTDDGPCPIHLPTIKRDGGIVGSAVEWAETAYYPVSVYVHRIQEVRTVACDFDVAYALVGILQDRGLSCQLMLKQGTQLFELHPVESPEPEPVEALERLFEVPVVQKVWQNATHSVLARDWQEAKKRYLAGDIEDTQVDRGSGEAIISEEIDGEITEL